MHRELSGNRYWNMVVGESTGGDFRSPFFLSLKLIIIGILVFAIRGQVDTTSSYHLRSKTKHLLPFFFKAFTTFFPLALNVSKFISCVLPIRSFVILLVLFYPISFILPCHKPKATTSYSDTNAKTRHTRSRSFNFDGKYR